MEAHSHSIGVICFLRPQISFKRHACTCQSTKNIVATFSTSHAFPVLNQIRPDLNDTQIVESDGIVDAFIDEAIARTHVSGQFLPITTAHVLAQPCALQAKVRFGFLQIPLDSFVCLSRVLSNRSNGFLLLRAQVEVCLFPLFVPLPSHVTVEMFPMASSRFSEQSKFSE